MLASLLNRLFDRDATARGELARYHGRVIRLEFPVIAATLTIDEHWRWQKSTADAEATLTLPLAFFITFAFDRTAAQKQLKLAGDADLAAGIGRVLGHVRWDAAEELSQFVGDVAANRLVWLAGKVGGIPGAIGSRMFVHLIEYWRDEAPLLANKPDVQAFLHDVDALRDDVARLEKRIERLNHKSF
ncbi:ubiquinone biosynthesis accessory factor UbiJ [Andreprevotia chitinilytica]|uniref:ubiquinone biosynthesis accessory factor UbiJ n=1 Tax=Andreprevotia chitinilytica TaxID=396808 RepID=UPI0005573992|nr:SCP2 sterol-binding domain-containing protein [Andreprevotia chitinilytica]